MKQFSILSHTILMLSAIASAYIWLEIQPLNTYSLQAFSLAVLSYLVIKRFNKTKIWHIAPAAMSFEMALATFAFLLLIGATGNLISVFYPLTYVHLFFLVFSTHPVTAIFSTFGILVFHYGLEGGIETQDIPGLITLPLIMSFFLFAKYQYQAAVQTKKKLEIEDKLLKEEESDVINFIETFLKPKLNKLKELLTSQNEQASIEIESIKQEVEELENHLDGYINDKQT